MMLNVSDFDNAWVLFNDYKNDLDFIGLRLIKIDFYGNETVYASK